MSGIGRIVTLSPRDYDAVLFDLDGVLTNTASVHAGAWKRLFDEFLDRRAARAGEAFVQFDDETDYRLHVDGKPRLDGVTDFLASRGIALPLGTPQDADDADTVQALARRKDAYFVRHIEEHGVERYEAAVDLVKALRSQDIKLAVVSSSRNCKTVLEVAGIAQLFDARVDGVELERLRLAGKPAPDMFLEAARRLGSGRDRTVVVEDAIAGVAAGRTGGFALVIGVDHVGQSQALREAGADVVVTSLAQIRISAEPPSAWSFIYEDFDPEREGMREALCALGNGYFAARGAAAWSSADEVHYPGTYVAGGYNRLQTAVAGRTVENESLVNFPNWLALGLAIDSGDWFDLRKVTILSYRQELDLRRGVLVRTIRFEDPAGRRSTLVERRIVSMAEMHLAGLELTFTAENWSGRLTVRSGIDGRVVNDGARLYRKFNKQHLEPVTSGSAGKDSVYLCVRTSQSKLKVAQARRLRAYVGENLVESERRSIGERDYVAQELDAELAQGESIVLEKIVALYTSRDHAISEPVVAACKAIERVGRFSTVFSRHALAWQHLWRRFDVHLAPS